MFTGIVEEVGRLRGLRLGAASALIEVAATKVLDDTAVGDSILTDGVCLTVTALRSDGFSADVMPETVRRSTLAGRRAGDEVNLERALTLSSRLGGHLVAGHVDGVGTVNSVERRENALVVRLAVPAEVARLSVNQGSIAVDGVSLTIVAVDGLELTVSLIPQTAASTTLAAVAPGRRVNLEADLIARYVRALVDGKPAAAGLTWQQLAEAGF